MFSSVRRHFGIPGVIAVVALVFAMLGGAYAASGGLSSKQKKEVKTIAKSFQGTGPAGPVGPGGPGGPAGPTGSKGDRGDNGTSVTSVPATLGECPAGGFKYTSASGTNKICNGETGFTETLPEGETETGAWSLFAAAASFQKTTVSFAIPLAAPLGGGEVHLFTEAGFASDCTGSAVAPTAPSGELCVYGEKTGGASSFGEIYDPSLAGGEEPGAATAGARIANSFSSLGEMYGTWAVTG